MMGSLKEELRAADSSVSVHTISPGMVLTGAPSPCTPGASRKCPFPAALTANVGMYMRICRGGWSPGLSARCRAAPEWGNHSEQTGVQHLVRAARDGELSFTHASEFVAPSEAWAC